MIFSTTEAFVDTSAVKSFVHVYAMLKKTFIFTCLLEFFLFAFAVDKDVRFFSPIHALKYLGPWLIFHRLFV